MTRRIGHIIALVALVSFGYGTGAIAQIIKSETYKPGVWIDPDGCSHWIMDDGAEGYMSPIRNRDGSAVCYERELCGIIPADPMFMHTSLKRTAKRQLIEFFRGLKTQAIIVHGYSDVGDSAERKQAFSERQALAVSAVAAQAGVQVISVQGFGGLQPRVGPQTTSAQHVQHRVEVYCVR